MVGPEGKFQGRAVREEVRLAPKTTCSLLTHPCFFLASRHRCFKGTVTIADSRRSREETTIMIRKKKKEALMKKRRMGSLPTVASDSADDKKTAVKEEALPATPSQLMQVYTKWVANPASVSDDELLETTKQFHCLLTTENRPIQEGVSVGAINIFTELLKKEDNPDIIFEAAWTLTNVSATCFTATVVTSGAAPILGNLIVHPFPHIREQAAWCIGNMAGKVQFRDAILNIPGVVESL